MTGNHTPGPWVVDGPPHNQIVWSDESNRICFLAHSAGMNKQRDLANGRLIAAAPELLDALKAINDAAPDMPDTLWRQVDAAIAKAEGPPLHPAISTREIDDADMSERD